MSVRGEYAGKPPYERRRERRVQLSIPVHVTRRDEASGAAVSCCTARSIDLSAGGVLLSPSERGTFVPGEIVSLSLTIPLEARGAIPFSLIAGAARVVRVASDTGEERVALAFCASDASRLASIVHR